MTLLELDEVAGVAAFSRRRMRGLLGPGMQMIGIVRDDPDVTPAKKVRYDAAVVVTRPVQPEGDFGLMERPGGAYATFTHKVPYEGLGRFIKRSTAAGCRGAGARCAPAFAAECKDGGVADDDPCSGGVGRAQATKKLVAELALGLDRLKPILRHRPPKRLSDRHPLRCLPPVWRMQV